MAFVVGIAGTAKNTGKTTTTSAMMKELECRKIDYALTSIGYDGEELDNVTGLPKPRLKVESGVLVAVAEKCLSVSSAWVEIAERTGILTPLGEIIIGRVKDSGLLIIAGPNKGQDLQKICARLMKYNARLILVDGALNRLTPMVVADGLILATGASRHQNINVLVKETSGIEQIFRIPAYTGVLQTQPDVFQNHVQLIKKVNQSIEIRNYDYTSLLTDKLMNDILLNIKYGYNTLWIPGVLGVSALRRIVDSSYINEMQIILNDPTKLLITGEVLEFLTLLTSGYEKKIDLYFQNPLQLAFLTINPFFPRYRAGKGLYEPSYVNVDELLIRMREFLSVPVLDVMKDGVTEIINWIEDNSKKND